MGREQNREEGEETWSSEEARVSPLRSQNPYTLSSVASRQFSPAMQISNCFHYSFLQKLIVFTVSELQIFA